MAIAERAASALVVRRAVSTALLRGRLDADLWAAAAKINVDGWRLFLRVERCAVPLQRLLARHPALLERGSATLATIAAAAQQETARILMARTHLRAAASVAVAHGLCVVLLKGGILT